MWLWPLSATERGGKETGFKPSSQYDADLGVTSGASASGVMAPRMTVHNSAFPVFASNES